MNDMWGSLGFKQSPYDARPLRPVPEDEDLLVGRNKEALTFCTALESVREGVIVLSGSPGVGKTSFFNVLQYRLAVKKAGFGPCLLPADRLCSVQSDDTPRNVALRVLENLVKAVQTACAAAGNKVPSETVKVGKWINSSGASGFDIGLSIFGFGGNYGRSVELPSIDKISFEGLRDAIECIVSEAVAHLGFDGAFIALDNVENLNDEHLLSLLMTFRDTLFMIPRVWWVIIGQRGLGTLIQTQDTRVSDRLIGPGNELEPLSFDELETAITLRVKKFSNESNPKSPLPTEVHKRLYDASRGEIRFVFKYSHEICTRFVADVRQQVTEMAGEGLPAATAVKVADSVASKLVNRQIPAAQANDLLKQVVTQEFNGLDLPPKHKKVLRIFAEKKEARPKDFEAFGLKSSQDFYSNYIAKLQGLQLLERRQQGGAVYYSLRGIAVMAYELGLLKNGSS